MAEQSDGRDGESGAGHRGLSFGERDQTATGTGARTVVGIMIGVVFFLMAKMLESGGEVFNMPPLMVAWLPTVLLTIITFVAVSRVR